MVKPANQSSGTTDFAQIWVRLFGAGSVCLGFIMIFLYFTTRHGPHALSTLRISLGTPLLILLGFAALFLYRWPALILSLAYAAVAAWLIVGSVLHVPFPWLLLNFAFGALLLAPAASTLYAWRRLR
jgi:hypothetical protein